MAFSFLLLFGLIFLGGVVGLVLLLTSPATRAVAGVLLSILGVFVVLALLAVPVFTLRSSAVMEAQREKEDAKHQALEVRAEAPANRAETGSTPVAEADLPAEKAPLAAERDPAAPPDSPPEWLEGKSSWTARDGASYWMRVRVGPYPREEPGLLDNRPLPRKLEVHELRQMIERDSLLRDLFHDAVGQAVARYTELLEPDLPVQLELSTHAMLSMLVSEAWQSAAETSDAIPLEPAQEYGELVDLHVLLKFDADTRQQLASLCRQKAVEDRALFLGCGLAVLLALLGMVLLYLKIDLATHGAYRGRLRLAVAATILLVVVAALMAMA